MLIGANNSIYVKGTNAFFLERASLSSLPFGIDDPPKSSKGSDISDLVVDLFNGCKTANLKAGSILPRSTAIVSTNYTLQKEERYTLTPQNGSEQ